jgi:hypothetical protein
MHERLIGHLSKQREKWEIRILPSFTLQITPTRFRVPDLVLFERSKSSEHPSMASVLLLEIGEGPEAGPIFGRWARSLL